MRTSVIQRKLMYNQIEVLCADVAKQEMTTETIVLRTAPKKDTVLMKKIKAMLPENLKPVEITSRHIIFRYFKMPEDQYLQYATEVTEEEYTHSNIKSETENEGE